MSEQAKAAELAFLSAQSGEYPPINRHSFYAGHASRDAEVAALRAKLNSTPVTLECGCVVIAKQYTSKRCCAAHAIVIEPDASESAGRVLGEAE